MLDEGKNFLTVTTTRKFSVLPLEVPSYGKFLDKWWIITCQVYGKG